MRLRVRASFAISTSGVEERDQGNRESELVVDTHAEGGTMTFLIPANAVNTNVQHPQVATGKFLFLRGFAADPNQPPVEMTVRRNSTGGDAWPLTPIDGLESILVLATSGLTALYVSNPTATPMRLTVGMTGD